jgi:hypothetical protein
MLFSMIARRFVLHVSDWIGTSRASVRPQISGLSRFSGSETKFCLQSCREYEYVSVFWTAER